MVWKELGNVKGEKGEDGIGLEFQILEDRIGIKKENQEEYQYTIPLHGKNLEFKWNGTKLGVKQEGEKEYEYVNLQAEEVKIKDLIKIVEDLPEEGEENIIYLKSKNGEKIEYALKSELKQIEEKLKIIEIVDKLPEKGKNDRLYFIKLNDEKYNIYAYLDTIWLKLNPEENLEEYCKTSEIEKILEERNYNIVENLPDTGKENTLYFIQEE